MTPLRAGIVLAADSEETCSVTAGGRVVAARYAAPFPRPRAERVVPGHLVALLPSADVVVWRWFDAIVTGAGPDGVVLWEPVHGSVVATPRDAARHYPVGSRAYASAGLPEAARRPRRLSQNATTTCTPGRFVRKKAGSGCVLARRGPARSRSRPASLAS